MNESGAKRKDNRKALGAQGEQLAADWLQESGMKLVCRNWRCRSGELDLVAEDGDSLVFIEVRTRRNTGTFGTAAESVDARKIRQVRETAAVYMQRHQSYGQAIRFDVVTVLLSREGEQLELQHIPAAF